MGLECSANVGWEPGSWAVAAGLRLRCLGFCLLITQLNINEWVIEERSGPSMSDLLQTYPRTSWNELIEIQAWLQPISLKKKGSPLLGCIQSSYIIKWTYEVLVLDLDCIFFLLKDKIHNLNILRMESYVHQFIHNDKISNGVGIIQLLTII